MKPVAFIIPWFGKDLKGGAEQFAWQFANRLSARDHNVEVLTTCCRSFTENWNKNHLKAGVERIDRNILIRRFKVTKRNADLFHSSNQQLLAIPNHHTGKLGGCISRETARAFTKENINSKALLKYIKQNKENYHAFIFIPYLYGPILNGFHFVL